MVKADRGTGKKKALITGITGQDGAYLAKFLLDKGYQVFGTYRRLSTPNFWRLQYLDVFPRIGLIPVDLVDAASITEAVKLAEPDEIYHLAAQSFVGASFEQPVGAGEIKGYGIFACNGILFNHESPLRGLEFVTRKISNAVAKIALGLEKQLELGNLEAKRDWGYAPEYVESMWLMLQQDKPDDYVIATGEAHSVREFAEKSFNIAGLDWQKYVKVDKRFLRPLDVNFLQGDAAKAKQKLGWEPRVKFDELVGKMVKEDLSRWEKWQKGDKFPWDAPNYPSEANIITRALKV